jgi:hypothetical protein
VKPLNPTVSPWPMISAASSAVSAGNVSAMIASFAKRRLARQAASSAKPLIVRRYLRFGLLIMLAQLQLHRNPVKAFLPAYLRSFSGLQRLQGLGLDGVG